MTNHAVALRAPASHSAIVDRPVHTFVALLARDLRVMRKDLVGFAIRTVTQPLLFIFVFAFVLPKLSAGPGASFARQPGEPSFATVLVPGLVASAILLQGLMAVATPLVMELSYTREIEDRVLAPVPTWVVGLAKITSGTAQAVIAAVVVFPCVLFVHAPGQAPAIDLSQWKMLIVVIVLSSALSASFGLLLGTVIDPRKLSGVFTVVLVPVTMLGCVYYPWTALSSLPWLKWATLANPLVYISEALRMALTPALPHLPTWLLLGFLSVGTAVVACWAVRTFARRLVD